jgi:hypothetical protein
VDENRQFAVSIDTASANGNVLGDGAPSNLV